MFEEGLSYGFFFLFDTMRLEKWKWHGILRFRRTKYGESFLVAL